VAAIVDRDNETWLAHLGGTGPRPAGGPPTRTCGRCCSAACAGRCPIARAPVTSSWRTSSRTRSSASSSGSRSSRGGAGFLTWAMSVAIASAMSELRRRRWKDVSLDEVVAGGDLTPGRAIVDEPVRTHSGARGDPGRDARDDPERADVEASARRCSRNCGGMPQDEIARAPRQQPQPPSTS